MSAVGAISPDGSHGSCFTSGAALCGDTRGPACAHERETDPNAGFAGPQGGLILTGQQPSRFLRRAGVIDRETPQVWKLACMKSYREGQRAHIIGHVSDSRLGMVDYWCRTIRCC